MSGFYTSTDDQYRHYCRDVVDTRMRFSNEDRIERITTDLIVKALLRAYENELPEEGCIFHSDRGPQYCSHEFQDLLQEYGLRSSMGRRAQCWDNASDNLFGQP